jgi:predicted phage terminase large subunit-like protein
LQLWPVGAPLPAFSQVVQSWDCAFKAKEASDYSVGFELGRFERGVFILDRMRGRFSCPALKEAAQSWGAGTRPAAVLIEDVASGQSLIQDLQQHSDLPVVPVKVDGDKTMRAHTIVPTWEANRIFVRADAPWLQEFLDELYTFPKDAHDDQCDSFVQGVRWLTQTHEPSFVTFSRMQVKARRRALADTATTVHGAIEELNSATMTPAEITAFKRKHATPIH